MFHWWDEADYGRKTPSAELVAENKEAGARHHALVGWRAEFRIAALQHKHERCHKGVAINAYSVSMDDLKPLNFTLGARWRLTFLAAVVWAIGGVFDGHGLRALITVPLFLGAWICATVVLDRWVRMRREGL
jgi:hypothetical protein